MTDPAFTTVLFDLDDTLCRYDHDPEAVVVGAFDRAGVDQFCGATELWDAAATVQTVASDHEFMRRTFTAAAERHGGDPADADALARGYEAAVDHSAVSFRPGAEAALALAADAADVGLVTNGSRPTQTQKLEALGIADAFAASVFSCDVSLPKPGAEPFERALAALSADPGETLYVGNSLSCDVGGAQAVGLQAAWFPAADHHGDPGEYAPDFTLDTLHDLADVLGVGA